jgi:glucose-6-phosphate 1-dehydrogenase
VLGASGDLAKKKTFPALWGLFREGLLPSHARIVGYARSKLSTAEFAAQVTAYIKAPEAQQAQLKAFAALCSYVACSAYDSDASMAQLSAYLHDTVEQQQAANRLFYLALPPSVFVDVGKAIKKAGFSKSGWNRVIVEKPFGRDSKSSQELTEALGQLFTEKQQYRIDHYLGKEMSQNLMVLRFANSFFEPLWNRHYINNVKITFKENIGTEGRGGYFDSFGIIRDVMQNHLMQLFALVAMEPPVSLNSEDVRDEKVKVLRATDAVGLEDVVIGQYGRSPDGTKEGYLDDKGVPKDSVTPTFAQAVLRINNPRWRDVPFIIKCGKALEERKAEIRIQFKRFPHTLFPTALPNELVIRVQPNEAIYMNVMNKVPGLTSELTNSDLDLSYKSKFQVAYTPEAYERLILDAIRGDQNLFVRVDELAAAWRIFTPLLHALESERIEPAVYPFGSRGPTEADEQAARVGWIDTHVKNVSRASL